MLGNDRGRKLVSSLPSNRLLTETDAPFTRFDNRSTVPNDVKATVGELAALRVQTPEAMSQIILSNLRALVEITQD